MEAATLLPIVPTDDDLFSTEEYQKTPEFSSISPPLLSALPTATETRPIPLPQKARPRPPKHYSHTEKFASLTGKCDQGAVLPSPFVPSDSFILPLDCEPARSCLDYFSKGQLRDDLHDLLSSLQSFPTADLKEAKREADPYSLLRETSLFTYPNAVLMANLNALFPNLIAEKNFLIPCYNFVTVCDKGGFAEFIQKRYSEINVSMNEVNGWALFPRNDIRVSGVTVLPDSTLNFETLEKRLQDVRTASDSEMGQSIMMLATDFSVKHTNPALRERLMKLYLCYSLYAAFTLLCKDGNLVVKVYSTYQPGTNECLYLLYRHFARISVLKPLACRSASSSKFIVCEGFDGSVGDREAVGSICKVMERLHKMGKDLEHVMELTQVTKSAEFLTYLLDANTLISSFQIARVKEVNDYLSSEEKAVPNKRDIAERCLIEWNLKKPEKREEPSDFPVLEAHRPTSFPVSSYGRVEGKVADLSQFKGILDRVPERGARFTPMTRFEKEGEDRNDYLASLSNDKRDAFQRSAKLLEQKPKKPMKRPAPTSDTPPPKKKQKQHSKK